MQLSDTLATLAKQPSEASVPILFDLSQPEQVVALEQLLKEGVVVCVRDMYHNQMRELFAIQNPALALEDGFETAFKSHYEQQNKHLEEWQQGRWVFFPWLHLLVHLLADREYQQVRTARNRELVSTEEQAALYESSVGVAGLSVGNSVALTLVLSGGAKHIKLADFDTLDLSNLNRIRAGVDSLSLLKTEVTARQIYLINPYAQVELFSEGLNEDSLQNFFSGVDVVVDELDSLPAKVLLREEARRRRVPVVMAADCGDAGIIDVGRYDLTPDLEFFHGRLAVHSHEELAGLSKREIGKQIAQLVGLENHTEKMLQSLEGLGRTLVSWPQLGSTAILNGAVLTFCIRKILSNQPLIDNRAVLSLDSALDPEYDNQEWRMRNQAAIKSFKKIFDL